MCQHLVFRCLDRIWIARLRTGILLSSLLTVSLSIQYLLLTSPSMAAIVARLTRRRREKHYDKEYETSKVRVSRYLDGR